jgi:HEPN domain-containing protein
MAERSGDWYSQAKRDLEMASEALKSGYFEWTCFISQQAAEKAVKAVFQKYNKNAWGHSVSDLLSALKEETEVPKNITRGARLLDRFYIPARYPDGFESGIPADYFDEVDAEDAVSCAEEIIRFCGDILSESCSD